MFYNLEIDIIIDKKLKKDKFYYYFRNSNCEIYYSNDIIINKKSNIILFNDYEFPLSDNFLEQIKNISPNQKLGETTYYLTYEAYLENNFKNFEGFQLCYKKNATEISEEKYIELKKLYYNPRLVLDENLTYKYIIDFIRESKIKPFIYIVNNNETLDQVISLYDEKIDTILFLTKENLSFSENKNIKVINDEPIIKNLINHISSFHYISIFKTKFNGIINKQILEQNIIQDKLILTYKYKLLLHSENTNIFEINDQLPVIENLVSYIDDLFNNKCYIAGFEIIEKDLSLITNKKTYFELVLKYIGLGLLIGEYNKVANNFGSLLNSDITTEEVNEFLPIIENFSNKNDLKAIIISNLSKNLNNKTIKAINTIIDSFTDNKLGNNVIKSLLKYLELLILGNYLEDSELEKIKSKCYYYSSHLIAHYNDILEFWSKIISKNDSKNLKELILIYKKNPEYLYYLSVNIAKIFETNKDRNKMRNSISENINFLLKNWDIVIPLDEIYKYPCLNFNFSYHGKNNREIFIGKSKLFRKICPELNYVTDLNYTNSKIKILFISEFLGRQHSVFKDRHQVIKYLSEQNGFEVEFATFGKLNYTKFEFGNAKHIDLPNNLIKARDKIVEGKYDIIFYCEIGMAIWPFYLAHMRLAKYQFNTWGHSDTSGISTIDYFISSKYFELDYEESQKHYSEKLVLMDSLSTCYVNPINRHPDKKWLTRAEYGFPENICIYSCLQSSFKYSPDFFDTVEKILNENKNAILLILAKEGQDKEFLRRISKFDSVARIHKYSNLEHDQYMNLVKISDIVLETYPFGSCNSSLEAFSLGLPVVTFPGEMINGRFTHGFYKYMGINDLIVNSNNEYKQLALKLAFDKKFYNEITNKIKNNSSKLFMDIETCKEYEKFFRNLKL